jgi:hypothetical protein
MCYEPAGKTWSLCFDGCGETLLEVSDEAYLTISQGDAPKKAPYRCLKADNTVYLLQIGSAAFSMLFALDTETNMAASLHLTEEGAQSMRARFDFGEIKRETGGAIAAKPMFSDDLAGNTLNWDFGGGHRLTHCYERGGISRMSLDGGQTALMEMTAVKLREAVYLLLLRGRAENGFFEKISCLIINFRRVTAVGFAFARGTDSKPFGAIGAFV